MSPEATTELVARDGSARTARRFVARILEVWDCDDVEEVAVLLTSEIVSNAVKHAVTDMQLRVSLTGTTVRVEVSDGHLGLPAPKDIDLGAESGRGLRLVDMLARRWGAERDGATGKVVWFELETSPDR